MAASGISGEANVPYSKVYNTLESLERKGWVETDHRRPSRYYPKSPSTAVEAMRFRQESERKANELQVLQELTPLYETKEARERPDIWIVRGEVNIFAKVRETISGCQDELLVAAPIIPAELIEFLRPALDSIRERRARVMIMTSKATDLNAISKLAPWANTRVREQMFGGGVISDAREVILLLAEEAGQRSNLAIWSDHPGLARFAKSYFEYLWNDSRPLT